METTYNDLRVFYLLQLFKNKEILKILAYMVDFKNHYKLEITQHENSIEISNKNITIVLVLFVDFKKNEYVELKNKKNFHTITFNQYSEILHEYKKIHLKYIDLHGLCFSLINQSKRVKTHELRLLLKLAQ